VRAYLFLDEECSFPVAILICRPFIGCEASGSKGREWCRCVFPYLMSTTTQELLQNLSVCTLILLNALNSVTNAGKRASSESAAAPKSKKKRAEKKVVPPPKIIEEEEDSDVEEEEVDP
jgi:hypothetical protein